MGTKADFYVGRGRDAEWRMTEMDVTARFPDMSDQRKTEDDLDTLPPGPPLPACDSPNRQWRDKVNALVVHLQEEAESANRLMTLIKMSPTDRAYYAGKENAYMRAAYTLRGLLE